MGNNSFFSEEELATLKRGVDSLIDDTIGEMDLCLHGYGPHSEEYKRRESELERLKELSNLI
jgi:hypothetical protein